jgi:predicted metal-dependent HD superfamily phosphohydrolase
VAWIFSGKTEMIHVSTTPQHPTSGPRSTTSHEKLEAEWLALFPAFAGDPILLKSAFDNLVARYTESGRYYHNLDHVLNLFETIRPLEAELQNPRCVKLAIFYHDAIYDSTRPDNEARSADLSSLALATLGCEDTVIARVKELILCTRSHMPLPDDSDCAIFLDCDLSILASNPETYAQYALGIRNEFSWVSPEVYPQRRVEVLERFLTRPQLFYSSLQNSFDAPARQNLAAEIAELKLQYLHST